MCWRSSVDGLLRGKRYLIHDRDSLFTDEFLCALKEAGVESVDVATAESEPECSRRELRAASTNPVWNGIGSRGLSRTAVRNFMAHYHRERNHQGLGNRLILPESAHLNDAAVI